MVGCGGGAGGVGGVGVGVGVCVVLMSALLFSVLYVVVVYDGVVGCCRYDLCCCGRGHWYGCCCCR